MKGHEQSTAHSYTYCMFRATTFYSAAEGQRCHVTPYVVNVVLVVLVLGGGSDSTIVVLPAY